MATKYLNRKPHERYSTVANNAMARLGDLSPDWAYTNIISESSTVSEAVGLLDYSVNRLNQRASHTMDTTYIIKYPKMAVVDWDFAVDGGAAEAHELNSGTNVIPADVLITNVFYDEITDLDSATNAATVTFTLTTATTALTGAIAVGDGAALGVPDWATAGDWVKTSAADSITATIGGEAATAGKIRLYVMYFDSE